MSHLVVSLRISIVAVVAVVTVIQMACSSPPTFDHTAVVIHSEGTVDVDSGDGFVPVLPKMALAPTATVRTGDASFLLLTLGNGKLVRLDANMTLPIGKIAGHDGPRATQTVAQQLESLFTADERARLPKNEVLAERVAGFQSTQRAGVTVGVQSAKSQNSVAASPMRGKGSDDNGANNATEGVAASPPPEPALKDKATESSRPAPVTQPPSTPAMPAMPSAPTGPAEDTTSKKKEDAAPGRLDLDGSAAGGAGRRASQPAKAVVINVSAVNGLDQPVVMRFVTTKRAGLLQCAASNGAVSFTIGIKANGMVGSITIAPGSTTSTAANECIAREVKTWHLPSPTSTAAKATVRLTFGPPS